MGYTRGMKLDPEPKQGNNLKPIKPTGISGQAGSNPNNDKRQKILDALRAEQQKLSDEIKQGLAEEKQTISNDTIASQKAIDEEKTPETGDNQEANGSENIDSNIVDEIVENDDSKLSESEGKSSSQDEKIDQVNANNKDEKPESNTEKSEADRSQDSVEQSGQELQEQGVAQPDDTATSNFSAEESKNQNTDQASSEIQEPGKAKYAMTGDPTQDAELKRKNENVDRDEQWRREDQEQREKELAEKKAEREQEAKDKATEKEDGEKSKIEKQLGDEKATNGDYSPVSDDDVNKAYQDNQDKKQGEKESKDGESSSSNGENVENAPDGERKTLKDEVDGQKDFSGNAQGGTDTQNPKATNSAENGTLDSPDYANYAPTGDKAVDDANQAKVDGLRQDRDQGNQNNAQVKNAGASPIVENQQGKNPSDNNSAATPNKGNSPSQPSSGQGKEQSQSQSPITTGEKKDSKPSPDAESEAFGKKSDKLKDKNSSKNEASSSNSNTDNKPKLGSRLRDVGNKLNAAKEVIADPGAAAKKAAEDKIKEYAAKAAKEAAKRAAQAAARTAQAAGRVLLGAVQGAVAGIGALGAPILIGIGFVLLFMAVFGVIVYDAYCTPRPLTRGIIEYSLTGDEKNLVQTGLSAAGVGDSVAKNTDAVARHSDLYNLVYKSVCPDKNPDNCNPVSAAGGGGSTASVACFAAQIAGKKDTDKITLWRAQNGVEPSKDMTVGLAKEILSFVGQQGITAEGAVYAISLATTESSGGKWDLVGGDQNACYGIIQLCNTSGGGNTFAEFSQAVFGKIPTPQEYMADRIGQIRIATYAFKTKLKVGRFYPKLADKSDIEVASAFWLGACNTTVPGSSPRRVKPRAELLQLTWEDLQGKPCGGGVPGKDYAESARRNFAIITCAAGQGGAVAKNDNAEKLDNLVDYLSYDQTLDSDYIRVAITSQANDRQKNPQKYTGEEKANQNGNIVSRLLDGLGGIDVEAAGKDDSDVAKFIQYVTDSKFRFLYNAKPDNIRQDIDTQGMEPNLAKLLVYLSDNGYSKMSLNAFGNRSHSGTGGGHNSSPIGAMDIGGLVDKGNPEDEPITVIKDFIQKAKATGVVTKFGLPPALQDKPGELGLGAVDTDWFKDGSGHIHISVKRDGAFNGAGGGTASSASGGGGLGCPPCAQATTPTPATTPATPPTPGQPAYFERNDIQTAKLSIPNPFGPVQVDAAGTGASVSVTAARAKLVSLFKAGYIGQTKYNTQADDLTAYQSAYDDNMILFLYDLYYKAGITWIAGFNNYGRGGDHGTTGRGVGIDFWAFANVSGVEGANKPLGTIDGNPSDFGSFTAGMGPTPSDQGNKSDPRIIRHIDNFSSNPAVAKAAQDMTLRVAELALSTGIAKDTSGNGTGVFQMFTTDKNAAELSKRYPGKTFQGHTTSLGKYANQNTPIGIANGHHNHLHLSLYRASVVAYKGVDASLATAGGSPGCPPCVQAQTTPTPATPPKPIAPTTPDEEETADLENEQKSQNSTKLALANLFTPIEVQAAFGSKPSSFSAISGDLKYTAFLKEIADTRGYEQYKDAKGQNTEMQTALAAMISASGGKLSTSNTYRSYDEQVKTYFATGGVTSPISKYWSPSLTPAELATAKAAYLARGTVSAPPGYSQHSTGLAVDFSPVSDSFENTSGYTWLKANATTFGFKESYPKGSSKGAGFEPWHWQFVGNATYKLSTPLTSFQIGTSPATGGSTGAPCAPSTSNLGSNTPLASKNPPSNLIITDENGAVIKQINGGQAVTGASIFKVIIASTGLKNSLDLNKQLVLSKDIWLPDETTYTKDQSVSAGELLKSMLNDSNNTAANALMKEIGGMSATGGPKPTGFSEKAKAVGYGSVAFDRWFTIDKNIPGMDASSKRIASVEDTNKALIDIFKNSGGAMT